LRAWKRTGTNQGNAIGFGCLRDCRRNGKRYRRFFATKTEAEKFILQIKRQGSVQRFLRVAQGLEAPREGAEATEKYKRFLPYFVLGGLQGLRTCEIIRERVGDPVIAWPDFIWTKKLIVVRDEVAKQTRARDKLRYVPLEPATVKLLKPLVGDGPVMPMAKGFLQHAPGTLQRNERAMARKLFKKQLRHVRANILEFWRCSKGNGRCGVDCETVLRADSGAWDWKEVVLD
jgi:hypothetical protein